MADKILISDELAQKFIDNAQNHIGISATLKGRVTLDKVKANIESGWGFNLSEANKCVCFDHEMMNANGAWGVNGHSPDMTQFWSNVYEETVIGKLYPENDSVHKQITIGEDTKLLAESDVNIKGCCVSLANALKDKLTISHSGVTSGTTVTIHILPRIGTQEGNTPILVSAIKYGEESIFDTPRSYYFDVNKDENLNWHIKAFLQYPEGSTFSDLSGAYFKLGDSIQTLSNSDGVGTTGTTFYTTFSGKTLNDILDLTKMGGYFPMKEPEPGVKTLILNVSDCKVIAANGRELLIKMVNYRTDISSYAQFCDFPDEGYSFTNGIRIPCQCSNGKNGKVVIEFNKSDMSRFTENNEYYMWVDLYYDYQSGSPIVARYCFKVQVNEYSINLNSYECYIDLCAGYTYNNLYYRNNTYNKDIQIKNLGGGSDNYAYLSPTGYLHDVLSKFVMNKVEFNQVSGSDFSNTPVYHSSNGVNTNLGSFSFSSYTTINLIPDNFQSISQVLQAMAGYGTTRLHYSIG